MKGSKNKDTKYLLIGGVLVAGAVAGAVAVALSRRRNIPKGVKAVKNFNVKKYLGKWYEIARFDYRFERTLKNTTAQYTLNNDGSIKVVNEGYNYKTNKQEHATGKAKFAGKKNVAQLKVSFFGPFYAGYNVIALDDDYNYALVTGKNRDYLWLLSRHKTMPDTVMQRYLLLAAEYGFDISNLTWVKQD